MATVEKQPVATAAKASALAAELEARETRAAELRASIPELRAAEETAVRESLRSRPKLRPFGDLHSPATVARRARERAEADLKSLELEEPLLRAETTAAVHAVAVADARRLVDGLAEFPDRYSALWSDLRQWHREGVALWLEPFQELVRERDAYLAAAEPVIGVAGAQAEWAESLERFRLGDDIDRGLPRSFDDVLRKLNAEFHVRDFDAPGADLIRENPTLVRARTLMDEGPAYEPPAPVVYRWLDLATAPLVEEHSGGRTLVSRDWQHPDTVGIDHAPAYPGEMLADGPRWRRIVVEGTA